MREAWGAKACAELQKDPYALIEKVRGFGFARADEVAQRMGVPADSPARIRAALCHLLEQAEQEGHCFVYGGNLVKFGAKLLGGSLDEGVVARELVALEGMEPPRIVRDGTKCYRPETHTAEVEVARAVEQLLAWVERPKAAAAPREEPRTAAFGDGLGAGEATPEQAAAVAAVRAEGGDAFDEWDVLMETGS